MIQENLYTMKNIVKIIQNPRKIILPFQERIRNLSLNYSESSTNGKKTNETKNNQINNNKDVEITYSSKGKEPEDKYFNDESSKFIDDLVTHL